MSAFQEKFDPIVHRLVASIPSGQVMSYGEIAKQSGFPRHSRMVSKSISRCNHKIPWHRVIKSDYTIGFPADSPNHKKQKDLLSAEGCLFLDGKVIPKITKTEKEDLDRLIWGP